jgi:hypothetical protein
MDRFQEFYNKFIKEEMISGDGGVFGDYSPGFEPPHSIYSTDSYAPGDTRTPKGSGIQRRPGLNTKRGRKKRKSKSQKPGPLESED